MNFASEIYQEGGYFGGYPNAFEFEELLSHGITLFVDLTTPREHHHLPFVYTPQLPKHVHYINFPIYDNHVPKSRRHFLFLLHDIILHLQNKKKVYIHCKGGHGRSGIVVASLLCLLYKLTPDKALHLCTMMHSYRPNLKPKWKHVPCPQLYRQQKYVLELFPFYPVTPYVTKHVDKKYLLDTIGSKRFLQQDRYPIENLWTTEKRISKNIICV